MKDPISQPQAFDMADFFEKALASPKGFAIKLSSRAAAIKLRQKLNSHRVSIRERNKAVYPLDNPMHGKSPYDGLIVAIPKEDETMVLIKPDSLPIISMGEIE